MKELIIANLEKAAPYIVGALAATCVILGIEGAIFWWWLAQ